MQAIYKRELKSCFHSMTGYVFIAFFIAFTGIYFMAYNLNYGYPYFAYVLSGIVFIYFAAIPVLTMRSFAEERKSRTDQLLLTAPVKLSQIIMGKYLSMVTVLAVPCIVFLLFPWIIKSQGTAYILIDYLSILVFFLLGCVYIAIGLFISSLTESQMLAAIGTFGALLILYLWSGVLDFLPNSAAANAVGIVFILSILSLMIWKMTQNWVMSAAAELIIVVGNIIAYVAKSDIYEGLLAEVLGKLDLIAVFNSISTNHLLDISGIILYLSMIGLFLFLTMEMIQKRRWS